MFVSFSSFTVLSLSLFIFLCFLSFFSFPSLYLFSFFLPTVVSLLSTFSLCFWFWWSESKMRQVCRQGDVGRRRTIIEWLRVQRLRPGSSRGCGCGSGCSTFSDQVAPPRESREKEHGGEKERENPAPSDSNPAPPRNQRPRTSLISMAVRFLAQAAGGVGGAMAILQVMPSKFKHFVRGPRRRRHGCPRRSCLCRTCNHSSQPDLQPLLRIIQSGRSPGAVNPERNKEKEREKVERRKRRERSSKDRTEKRRALERREEREKRKREKREEGGK